MGVPFSRQVEIAEEHGQWGVRTRKRISKGNIVCQYTSNTAITSQSAVTNPRYALHMTDGRVFDSPAEGDLQYGPLVNDSLDSRLDNVRTVVSYSDARCYLQATKNIPPDTFRTGVMSFHLSVLIVWQTIVNCHVTVSERSSN